MNYQQVADGYDVDLSQHSIEEAAIHLSASFEYELRVSALGAPRARRMLHAMGADVRHHPFAPYINLVIDETYRSSEWSLSANGRAFGSKGVT